MWSCGEGGGVDQPWCTALERGPIRLSSENAPRELCFEEIPPGIPPGNMLRRSLPSQRLDEMREAPKVSGQQVLAQCLGGSMIDAENSNALWAAVRLWWCRERRGRNTGATVSSSRASGQAPSCQRRGMRRDDMHRERRPSFRDQFRVGLKMLSVL